MNVNWREYCKEVKQGEQKQNKMRAEVAVYKSLVTGVASKAWDALKRMGRPMWWNTFTDLAPQKSDRKVISLAANKLLLGQSPGADTHNKNTMFGVASMLCRLGVRPYSTSTLASRAVADFTAILAYVNYEKEGYLSSYASDPVLALGAMNVWYALDAALPTYILPQLKKLILDEALDTGGVGEIVARIVLLLAMDKCAMEDKPFSERTFTGQFVSVAAFLNELGGDGVSIYSKLCR
ncbi:uncharacterized protein KRP23_224 [Phytophthora ramorum]|uniref:uncharacterized protein n=1 Tax=Phytophthora ramorum TaxID=164328 RepID=UPI0030B337D4|nr:hypothetical protein KRP23_224 [Phytophthora ramorum]